MSHENQVIKDFGEEWERFNFSDPKELKALEFQFSKYISPMPKKILDEKVIIADFGAGTGRWSYFLKDFASRLYLVEPSEKAFRVAYNNLSQHSQICFLNQSVESNEIQENSLDLAVSLGVLHHIEDTSKAIKDICAKIKPGGLFLGYLYYSLDNKPWTYRAIWKVSDIIRRFISWLPNFYKRCLADVIAVFIYYPLSRFSRLLSKLGYSTSNLPLHHYENLSLYVMRNDALDRFGTTLEQRFSQEEISEMLSSAGFTDIKFSDIEPYWTFVAIKK